MPYVKDVTCNDCASTFTVRKDSNPIVCKRCASVRGGKATKGAIRAAYQQCKGCDKKFRVSLKQNYCSYECRDKNIYTIRCCKFCNQDFKVLKKSIGNNTNASGNFCKRDCYERWLCRTERVSGRGSQWKKIRTEVIKKFPFCAVCGTQRKLQVHHIIPYRLTHDNSKKNLIPLCIKHHRWVESIFLDTESAGLNEHTGLIWQNILRSRQMATLSLLNDLRRRSFG